MLLLLLLFCFLRQGNPDCPGTHSVDQADFKLTEIACLCLLSAGIKGVHHHPPTKVLMITIFSESKRIENASLACDNLDIKCFAKSPWRLVTQLLVLWVGDIIIRGLISFMCGLEVRPGGGRAHCRHIFEGSILPWSSPVSCYIFWLPGVVQFLSATGSCCCDVRFHPRRTAMDGIEEVKNPQIMNWIHLLMSQMRLSQQQRLPNVIWLVERINKCIHGNRPEKTQLPIQQPL